MSKYNLSYYKRYDHLYFAQYSEGEADRRVKIELVSIRNSSLSADLRGRVGGHCIQVKSTWVMI